MAKCKKLFILILFLSFPFLALYASLEKGFKRMNMQNGLAGNSVYSIFKDKDGFIWFGTGDGLSRYDGRSICSFASDKFNMTVEQMYDTSDGLLLFITKSNLHCFDRYRECFVPTDKLDDKKFYYTKGLVLLNDSVYWSISKNKLHLLKRILRTNGMMDNGENSFSLKVLQEYILTDEGEIINNICESSDKKKLFLTTEDGKLLVFNLQTKKIDSVIPLYEGGKDLFLVSSLLCDDNYLWISTVGGGVLRCHLPDYQLDYFKNGSGSGDMLSHNDVYALVRTNDKYLAATWNGYTIFSIDKKTNRVKTEVNNQIDYLLYNWESRMLSAYYDSKGLLYLGTHGGGVIVEDVREQFYHRFMQKKSNEICDILSDDKGYVWLATFHDGVLRSDVSLDVSEVLSFSEVNIPAANVKKTVLCIMKDEDGNLWFGNSDASITYYQVSSGMSTVYDLPQKYKRNDKLKLSTYVWKLFIDSKHRFWVATRNGLLLFNRQTKRFSPVSTKYDFKYSIRTITEDKNGVLWLGTPNGLFKMYYTRDNQVEIKGGYEQLAGLNASYVRALHSSADGYLYIGYIEGLGILKQDADTIQHFYTTRAGLSSNFITCITEDIKGHIWLGTNSGISRYSRHQNLFYNYYISGSNRSVAQIGNLLFFGNNYALTYFNPDTVIKISPIEKNLLLDLEVNNKRVVIGEKMNGQVILERGLPYTNRIVLKHVNRDFSLSFSNLLYSEELQKYNYRLLPYQQEWIVCSGGDKASYTNLPTGEYVFEVKSIYPDGTDSVVNSLSIRILPHWHQTVWFRLCIFLLIMLLSWYVIYRIRREQRRVKRELLLKHELFVSNMERTKEKQIRVERENFFTYVAHELRTPLTLVLSPLQELLYRKTKEDSDYSTLKLMYENGTSLHRLVDDLLSVQKIEAGMMKLNVSETNIIVPLKDVSESFRQLAISRDINFVVDLPEECMLLWVDLEKVTSAVRNLFSNAFKYTADGGKITIKVSGHVIDAKEYCRIVVSDTGVGIPFDLQNRVFESFVTGNATPSVSTKMGIGLRIVKNTMDLHHGTVSLQSAAGEGCTFILDFPKGNAHFADDDEKVSICQTSDIITVEGESDDEKSKVGENTLPKYKYTLLIIEDNQDVRKYVASLFNGKYNILEAEDGEKGIEVATHSLPDLIISDVMMPVKDGFTCCKEIHEQAETAHIPILMLTAKAEDTDIIRGTQIGVDDYMMKPFNPEILKAKVKNLILHRESLKRIYTKSLMLKQTAQDAGEDDFMQKVINIIEANLSNELFNVQMLAEQLNMSQPTLYRKVKERSELSIIKFIRSVRMSKAAALIMENKYSVLEISEMVGFNDLNTFRKHFTEQFGVLPSKFGSDACL